MQNDCEIYVDPEEDEVFFGCVSEREKNVHAKLVDCAEASSKDDKKLNEVFHESNPLTVDEERTENVSEKEQPSRIPEEITLDDTVDSTEPCAEPETASEKDTSKVLSNNSSVELEHNYSTPMKHKIDKSILTTPKSVVKADKDGGFLKVLSEIALVKAEAEGDKNSHDKREDEDKENKLISSLPEIRVTEATPEKGTLYSPPKSVSTELRRFRIIYSSPQKEENSNDCKTKSHGDTLESEKNFINKCLDRSVEKIVGKDKRKSIELIDFNDCTNSEDTNEGFEAEKDETVIQRQTSGTSNREEEKIGEAVPEEQKAEPLKCSQPLSLSTGKKPPNLRFSKEARKIVEVLKKSTADDTLNFTIPEIDVEEEENSFLSPEPVSAFDETVIPSKMVEIQQEKASPRILTRPADNKVAMKSKSVEKDRRNIRLTPTASQSKLQPLKYFSERRIYNQTGSEAKGKCVKKLPLEEKTPSAETKLNGGRTADSSAPSSRIPVFGTKNSKLPLTERTAKSVVKSTPSKTPTGKSNRNPKFNHIESPINAYIHNKPTSLVLNVKPEVKKDCLAKVWKAQATGSEKKIQEKTSRLQAPSSAVKLPFVEYKSGASYKIEKRPESRLPRLAPNVMKLIGSHSPKVLKHEGRFYVNTPRKQSSTENSTIVADPNEVSVVVSQPVQKSNTIK